VGWDGMGRGGKGRERRGGMGKGLGGSTASWLLGGMDATGVKTPLGGPWPNCI
jgi:hypothetical protein